MTDAELLAWAKAHPDHPPAVRFLRLMELDRVVREVHAQVADDHCWMDIDLIFAAAGLPVPDRRVGDQAAMHENCRLYIKTMCQGGGWKSYAELQAEVARKDKLLLELTDRCGQQCEIIAANAAWRPTELQQFLAMLRRAWVGHGTRTDHNPAGTAVQVEHPVEDSETAFWVSEWAFDAAGTLTGVAHYEGEPG